MRKITGGVQLNISSAKGFKGADDKKVKDAEEGFSAIMESSTAAVQSCEEGECDIKSCLVEKTDSVEGSGKTAEKEVEDSLVPLIPAELLLQKTQESDPVAEPSAEQKASISQKTDQPPSNGMTEAASEAEPKQGSKDEAIVFKGLMAAADVQSEGVTPTGTTEPAEDISWKPQKSEKVLKQKQNSGEAVPKPEALVGNPLGAVDESAPKIKTGDLRAVPNEPAAASATPSNRNIQIASSEIIHRMKTLSEGESTAVKVKLHPEGLGEMEITMSMEKGKLSGSILVENKEIRQIFTDRIHELSQTLKESNISVAKFDVGIGAGQDQSQSQERQQGQRHERYHNRTMRFMEELAQYDERKMSGQKELRGIDMLA